MSVRAGGLAALATILSGGAMAQTPSSPPSPETAEALRASVRSFEPDYFARYNPNTALDMIQQVPGFSVFDGERVRGFGGAAGNVLINGERPSTKTDLSDLLGRIPASSVIRVDLVTGASATLDMRGQTKVVNVLVRESAAAQPVTFDATLRQTPDGRLTGQLKGSTQRSLLGGSAVLSLDLDGLARNYPGGGSFVDSGREKYLPSGASFEHGAGFSTRQPFSGAASVEYERDASWGALRLNGSYTSRNDISNRFFENFSPDAQGPRASIETGPTKTHERTYTLGGDVERQFSGASVKVITFNRRTYEDTTAKFILSDGAGAFQRATTIAPESTSGEDILRGQIDWKIGGNHSIQVAAETAYTFLESQTQFTLDTPTTTSTFFIGGSNTKVEEFRNEFQVSDVWTVSPNLIVEPGFKFEMSRIEQQVNYVAQPNLHAQRKFQYPKPSITGTWRLRPNQQLRVSYAREVAQLSFDDFVSSLELVNNQTTGGNPDLVPERTWALNAQFEQRFWKGGVLTLLGSYDQVEDVQDFVPRTVNTSSGVVIVDAPGNIGDGTRWSVGVKLSTPLDNLGIPNARVDASLSGGGSKVTDPTTLRSREFSDEFKEEWNLSFRQDFPAWKFSYGFEFSDGGPATAYRYSEASRRSRDDPDFSMFVETTRFFGLRARAGLENGLSSDFSRTRLIYNGARGASTLNRTEQSHSSNGVQPFVRISGNF